MDYVIKLVYSLLPQKELRAFSSYEALYTKVTQMQVLTPEKVDYCKECLRIFRGQEELFCPFFFALLH